MGSLSSVALLTLTLYSVLMKADDTVTLQLHWTQTPEASWLQGARYFEELLDSDTYLQRVAEEIEEAASARDIQHGALALLHRVEGYFHNIYQLRERAISVLACITGENCGALKNPKARADAAASLRPLAPEAVDQMLPLLQLLDSDIQLRNNYVHNEFPTFKLCVGAERYDLESVLLNIQQRTPNGPALEEGLRRAMSQLADQYSVRIRKIMKSVSDLIPAIDPLIARGRALPSPSPAREEQP
jgi:hypothetical protein